MISVFVFSGTTVGDISISVILPSVAVNLAEDLSYLTVYVPPSFILSFVVNITELPLTEISLTVKFRLVLLFDILKSEAFIS